MAMSRSNCALVNGVTERREFFTIRMSLTALSFLIASSVTGRAKGFGGDQIDANPIAFLRRRVWISFAGDAGQADNLLLADAVIEKNRVAFLHRAQVVARLEIADAGPGRAAVLQKVRPGIGFGFCFTIQWFIRMMSRRV
jgi:hypothetical protein